MNGKIWEYKYDYIPQTDLQKFQLLSEREVSGWEVLNITGPNEGCDVIWFKRKLLESPKPPEKRSPCRHGVEDGYFHCICCSEYS